MSLLAERWKGLASLPHVPLVTGAPTPAVRMERLSERLGADVWVKRDDLTSRVYGGNKVRKLEWLLGDARAQGADTLVTVGALGSHHVLATTLHGTREGFDVHAVVGPQPSTPHVLEDARLDLAAGATLHPVRAFALVPARVRTLIVQLRLRGKRPYVVKGGGSSPVGALGYVEAGLELAAQLDARSLPEPRVISVAYGTGGTVAGLAVGLAAAGVTAPLTAVRVTDVALANRAALGRLVARTVALLRAHDDRFPDVTDLALGRIRIDSREFGPGYGLPTESGARAVDFAAQDGLVVETTYTAKALAGLVRQAQDLPAGTPMLYLHTLSSADQSALLARAPELPPKLAALAR
jgi:1-aminocyclopropane-1-carboxylate deaminase/D-cysteine desulfhydrase-like pyridoxal-dependent ACC family enzyme